MKDNKYIVILRLIIYSLFIFSSPMRYKVGAEKLTRSCPAGIDVTLILSRTYLSKRDLPKVLITAKRRSWRCLSSAWAQQSVKERKLLPTEGHLQDLRQVLAHVRLNEVGANDE